MVFSAVDQLDMNLLELPWKRIENKLVLEGLSKPAAQKLIKTPGVCDRIALLVKKAGLDIACIRYPGSRNGFRVFACAAPPDETEQFNQEVFMTSLSNTQVPDHFVWFGGIIDEPTDHCIKRMRESDEPMGLVLPVQENGIVKTIQLGINKASIDLFQFNDKSIEDMRSAIQRDTSGDWYGEDLGVKQQLFRDAGTSFEQSARIRTKLGWILMWFGWERVEGSSLVIGRGRQQSDVVDSPDRLLLV